MPKKIVKKTEMWYYKIRGKRSEKWKKIIMK